MQKLEKSISQATVAKSDDNFSKIQGYLDQVISVTEMIKLIIQTEWFAVSQLLGMKQRRGIADH